MSQRLARKPTKREASLSRRYFWGWRAGAGGTGRVEVGDFWFGVWLNRICRCDVHSTFERSSLSRPSDETILELLLNSLAYKSPIRPRAPAALNLHSSLLFRLIEAIQLIRALVSSSWQCQEHFRGRLIQAVNEQAKAAGISGLGLYLYPKP